MSRAVQIDSVTTYSGSAGGSTRQASVMLHVVGKADTVAEVQAYVEQAVRQHDALVAALKVLTLTPTIRAFLQASDPQALRQAERALEAQS